MTSQTSRQIDLRGTPCPMNFVRIKLELDRLPHGAVLQVTADGGDTGRDILRSLEQQGFPVADIRDDNDSLSFQVSRRHA